MTTLDVDLTLAAGDDDVSITGDESLVVVDTPSIGAAIRLQAAVKRLRAAVPAPGSTPLEPRVDVEVRGVRVARVAPDASPGVLSSLLGVGPARISVVGVCRAAVRRLRPVDRGDAGAAAGGSDRR